MSLALRLLRSRCTLYESTGEHDGRGGWQHGLRAYAHDVPCKLDPSSRSEELVGDKERAVLGMRFFVPADQRISTGVIAELDDGRVVKVLTVEPPGGRSQAGAGGQVRCVVEQIQRGELTELLEESS